MVEATNASLISCHVCGYNMKFESKNYGGISCKSCRAFFRRLHNNSESPPPLSILECTGYRDTGMYRNLQDAVPSSSSSFHPPSQQQQLCTISHSDKYKCPKCRYIKCLNAGMNPDLVLNEHRRAKLFAKAIKKNKFKIIGTKNARSLKPYETPIGNELEPTPSSTPTEATAYENPMTNALEPTPSTSTAARARVEDSAEGIHPRVSVPSTSGESGGNSSRNSPSQLDFDGETNNSLENSFSLMDFNHVDHMDIEEVIKLLIDGHQKNRTGLSFKTVRNLANMVLSNSLNQAIMTPELTLLTEEQKRKLLSENINLWVTFVFYVYDYLTEQNAKLQLEWIFSNLSSILQPQRFNNLDQRCSDLRHQSLMETIFQTNLPLDKILLHQALCRSTGFKKINFSKHFCLLKAITLYKPQEKLTENFDSAIFKTFEEATYRYLFNAQVSNAQFQALMNQMKELTKIIQWSQVDATETIDVLAPSNNESSLVDHLQLLDEFPTNSVEEEEMWIGKTLLKINEILASVTTSERDSNMFFDHVKTSHLNVETPPNIAWLGFRISKEKSLRMFLHLLSDDCAKNSMNAPSEEKQTILRSFNQSYMASIFMQGCFIFRMCPKDQTMFYCEGEVNHDKFMKKYEKIVEGLDWDKVVSPGQNWIQHSRGVTNDEMEIVVNTCAQLHSYAECDQIMKLLMMMVLVPSMLSSDMPPVFDHLKERFQRAIDRRIIAYNLDFDNRPSTADVLTTAKIYEKSMQPLLQYQIMKGMYHV